MNFRFSALLIAVLFSANAYAVLPPVAVDDNVSTPEDTPLVTNVLANDSDQGEGDILSVTPQGASNTANGSFSCSATDCSYSPATNFNGADSYSYEVCDNEAVPLCDTGAVNVTVTAVNDAPLANPQSVSTVEDTVANITLTGSDIESSPLTFSIGSSPSKGVLGGTGANVTYTPNLNATGPDSFTFRANDGGLDSPLATVTINISPVNDAPTADPQTVNTDEDTPVNITLTGSDPETDPLTFSVNGFPSQGTLSGGGANLIYTPNAGVSGQDSFTFRVNDGNLNSPLATVTINVAAVNDPPVADPQTVSTAEDTPLNITLTGSDPESASLSFAIGSGPSQGSLSGTAPNLTYTPNAGISGQDSFTFRVNDGSLDSPLATVTINVSSVNDPPVADPQTLATNEDTPLNITLTGSDPESASLSFAIGTSPSQGSLSGTAPNLTYTPNAGISGQDSFTFRVNDGSLDSPLATVTINIAAVNDVPVADDQTLATAEDTAIGITLTGSDPDQDTLSFAIATQPAQGTLSGTAPNVTYTPDAGVSGPDSFTFTVNDGQLTSTPGTITINVSSVNDPPVADAQSVSTDEDVPVAITLTGTDPDQDTLSFAIATQPAQGTLSGTPPSVTYTPNAGLSGTDSFTFTVNDGEFTSAAATVTISVASVNDVPVADGQAVATAEDVPIAITLTGSDAELSALTFAVASAPAQGTLSGIAPDLIYTPNLDFNGPDSFTFTVNDGVLTSLAATVSITVTAVNDLPTVFEPIGPQNAVEGTPFSLNVVSNFSDADGEALVFTATGLPGSGNITLSPQGLFSGTPRLADTDPVAVYDITVTATDAAGDFITDMFQFTISALDRANVSLNITVAPDPAMIGDQLAWTFAARNPLGPQTATNVQLNGSFAGTGLTVTESGGSSCTIQAGGTDITTFQCAMGALPKAGSTAIILNTTTSVAGDVYVFATAAGTDALPIDPNLEDNAGHMAVGVAQSFSNGVVQVLGNSTVRSVTAGDLDGDGMADLVVGTGAGQPIQVYLSGGFRDFLTPPITLNDTGSNEGVALADFNGDNTLDLAVANGGGLADMIYSNDGAGNFTALSTLSSTFGQGIAVGDFDNDGRMDVAIATIQGNPVYLGNGNGGFTLHATLGNANSHAVAVGQFNADGRDDLVFANIGSDSVVWTKNAGNGFSASNQLAIGDAAAVTVGEFGGDARPDLAFGRQPSGSGDVPANPVLINDGSGQFGSPLVLLGAAATFDIHAGDVNGDSITDLVFINASNVHQIWNGTGGGFELHSEQIVDTDSSVGVLTDLGMTDVGNPGGVDLAMGGAVSAGLGVLLNDGQGNLGKGDVVAPVLTLIGQITMDIASGTVYTDAGATALDNIDGNISSRIVVSNPVNTSTVGLYSVTYNVTDLAGNAAAPITRTVNVLPAVGTGGGGGGAVNPLALLFLMLSALLAAVLRANRAKRAIIPARDRQK